MSLALIDETCDRILAYFYHSLDGDAGSVEG